LAHDIGEDPSPRRWHRHRRCLARVVIVSIGRELEIVLGDRIEPCSACKAAMTFVDLGELAVADVEEEERKIMTLWGRVEKRRSAPTYE
jgi:hypothetical protein